MVCIKLSNFDRNRLLALKMIKLGRERQIPTGTFLPLNDIPPLRYFSHELIIAVILIATFNDESINLKVH